MIMVSKEDMVRITDVEERITHWILAGSFLIALITG